MFSTLPVGPGYTYLQPSPTKSTMSPGAMVENKEILLAYENIMHYLDAATVDSPACPEGATIAGHNVQ